MAINNRVGLPPFQSVIDGSWHEVALIASALAGPQDAVVVADHAWERALAAYGDELDPRFLRGWVLEIATRTAVEHHRARQREHRSAMRPEASADANEERTWSLVRALPERERTALVLHFVGGVAHNEIAAIMGTTVTTARRFISDALRALRGPG